MKAILSAALDLIYPRICVACGRSVGEAQQHVCWDCLAKIQIVAEPFCAQCGDPAEGTVETRYVCSWCRRTGPHFELARSAARHRGPLRHALHAYKYLQATYLTADFVAMLTACVWTHYRKVDFDGVAHVPLYPARERERTYNQAGLLAAGLAGALRVPLAPRGLRRVRATATQTHLSASERRVNVKGAFEMADRSWIEGRRLLLVDDVMTTGATVNECAGVLREAGAASVHVATVARG